MDRRVFLGAAGLAGWAGLARQGAAAQTSNFHKPKDYHKEPFKRLVILGESTVQGGGWLDGPTSRYADVLVKLINACQERPIEYFNKGIGANAISPRSPGYGHSVKPSALERYKTDVIALRPDLFILAYGLNDMRAAMPLDDFAEDIATILRDVKQACDPMIVLTTIYYMTGWRSYAPYDKGSVELTESYNARIRKLAEQFDCVLADVWSAEGGADWLIHPDGVHANRIGNIVIANRIFEVIAQHASGLTNTTFAELAETPWTKRTAKTRAVAGDPWRKTW